MPAALHKNPVRLNRRPIHAAVRDGSGATAVEFALLAPLLLFMLFGIIQFGMVLNNYVELTDSVRNGARNFAISRASASGTPYSTTVSAISAGAPNLTAGSIVITIRVNGTACTTDSGCTTALSSAAGQTAYVSATYPCNLTIMNVNFASGCTLTATTSDLIE
jgi:Flp pilus assembly protein TadG